MGCKLLCLDCTHGGQKNLIINPMPDNQSYLAGVKCCINGKPIVNRNNLRVKCNDYEADGLAEQVPTPTTQATVISAAGSTAKEIYVVTPEDMAKILERALSSDNSILVKKGVKVE